MKTEKKNEIQINGKSEQKEKNGEKNKKPT